jgi:hypothetical protein
MDKDYVIIAHGTPIKVAVTARGANRLAAALKRDGLVVERVDPEFAVAMLRREAELLGIHLREDMPSLSSLMKEFINLPLGDERYFPLLNELVFWIPFVSRKSWKEMALEHLGSLGWEDESIPSYPSVPEVMFQSG